MHFAKSVVINKKNMMPGKVDKPTQNSALQGILEQENFMIKVFSSATAESVLLSEMPENQGIVGL